MLQSILVRAQRSIDSLATKYILRLVAAVPFAIAAGFGTAAAAIKLSDVYDPLTAYTILAVAFAGLGLVVMAAIAVATQSPAEVPVEEAETVAAEPLAAATDVPNARLALAAFGALGPAGLSKALGLLARNLPLVAGVLVLAYLMLAEAADRDRVAPDPAE